MPRPLCRSLTISSHPSKPGHHITGPARAPRHTRQAVMAAMRRQAFLKALVRAHCTDAHTRTRTHARTQTQTDRLTDTKTETHTDIQTDRQTERQTDRHTHRQTDRQTDRQRHLQAGFPQGAGTVYLACVRVVCARACVCVRAREREVQVYSARVTLAFIEQYCYK